MQYLSDENLDIFSDHNPILCLNAKSEDISSIGGNYQDQNIHLFEIIYEGRIP